jgi:hypothetical protein
MLEDRFGEALRDLRPRHLCTVGLADVVLLEEVRVAGGDLGFVPRLHALQERDERLLPVERNPEVPDVPGVHPREPGVPVESRRPVRRASDRAGRSDHAVRQTGGARQRVRASA